MNIIIIAGAMRSGKTRLAEALSGSLGLSFLSSDHLVLALRHTYPETGVGAPGKSFDELCDA